MKASKKVSEGLRRCFKVGKFSMEDGVTETGGSEWSPGLLWYAKYAPQPLVLTLKPNSAKLKQMQFILPHQLAF